MEQDIARLAIIGAAHIHIPEYIRAVNDRPDAAIVAVHDANEHLAQRAAEAAHADVRDMPAILTDDTIDAVVVCAETVRHPGIVDAVIEHRKAVFVEKPLTTSSRDGFALARRIVRSGVHYRSGFFMQRLESLRLARTISGEGRLGRITRARISVGLPAALDGWFDDWPWMADASRAGFGGFGDLGIHAADLLIWILGDEPVAATGWVGGIDHDPPGVDHFGEGLVRFANGGVATIAASWVDPKYSIRLDLFGSAGSLHMVDGHITTRGFDLGEVPVARFPSSGEGIDAFVEELNGEVDPLTTATDPMAAAMAVAVIEACYRGAREQRWIGIERSSGAVSWDLRD